ncbi:MAG: leucyl/phenylalanyl-tRNA--protein transferase [Spirochaetota bacterium]|nr:leucyl/phenylalanyl-tRNA--protein transferase [Spirochaetota bacterium]
MIFELRKEIIFPPVHLADQSGIIAVGGDLSPARLIEAYRNGIFPWYSEGEPITWWSPDPRFVLFPKEIIISKSMRKTLRKNIFQITYNRCFKKVILGCKNAKRKQTGTWITNEMAEAYIRLHNLGYAHSIEAWKDGELAGGMYGVSLGKCFFGESMFTNVSNASKAAIITLAMRMQELDFSIIDCQVYTDHLDSLGARMISREEFISIIDKSFS